MREMLLSGVRATGLGAMILLASSVVYADQLTEEQKLVNDAVQTVERMKADPSLTQSDVLRTAKAVFIMPHEQIGGTVVRIGPAPGVLLGHRDGRWSDPAFYNVASLLVPHQNGGNAGPLVLLLMSDKAVHRFLNNSDVSVNTKHGLAVAHDAPEEHDGAGNADVIEWGGATGGFSGQKVSISGIAQNSASNRDYYGHEVDAKEILHAKAHNPGADKLRQDLSGPG